MKLRLVVGALAFAFVGFAAASCGSSDSSVFPGSGGDSGVDLSEGGGTGFGNTEGGAVGGNGSCKPLTCKDLGNNCGPAGDGCGGKIDCGTCVAPQTCGGGAKPSTCGGTQGCVVKTCKDLGINCGPAGDGCGGEITTCGTCNTPEFCGGAGPSKCGGGLITDGGPQLLPDGGVCDPRTTCNAMECGPVADGCGGLLTCPGCTSGLSCGGGGVASMCGAPACAKTTCALQKADCGFVADGCGGLLNCGGASCALGFCGGGGPNKCGLGTDAGVPCVNFCTSQAACAVNSQTTVTGTVFAPNGTLPLPGAIIYVPNGALTYPFGVTTFSDGVAGGTCDSCAASASGNPLVTTTSAFDGTFTLQNVPAGVAFPIVVQLGRWRRVIMIPAITKCTSKTLTAAQTRLPVTQNEGGVLDNIPLFALSTGQIDGLECVFRKLGILDSQFGNPGGAARIQFYLDDEGNGGAAGATYDGSTPSITSLYASQAQMEKYDALVFACAGAPADKPTAARNFALNYANEGGRIFATHYNYTWLYDVVGGGNAFTSPWGSAVQWIPDNPNYDNNALADVGLIDTTAKGGIFDKWLGAAGVNALSATAPDRVALKDPRYDAFTPVDGASQSFITQYNPAAPAPVFHLDFNTPYNAATQCGRVIFSDFHVSIGNTAGTTFHGECNNNALTAQEKILAFMLFDLTSCIQQVQPTCTKIGCGAQTCGPASDGCGGQQDCGTCAGNQVCQGTPSTCVTPPCTKAKCSAGECGLIPDGCNGSVDCGLCATGTCGGNGANQCGGNSCAPLDCPTQNIHCGPAGDGCGKLIDCGPCAAGFTCGGGGTPGVCGKPTCTPRTCAAANANCGPIADGCGGSIDCGTCTGGLTCGGGGTPNQCGGQGVH
jgi:hypothetical protein